MSLRKYAEVCTGLASELKGCLAKEEVDDLRRDLGSRSLNDWMAWCVKHERLISLFVSCTPRERERRKEWANQTLRGRLILAGIQHILNGQALLRLIEEYETLPGISYRDMAAQAGETFQRVAETHIPYWNLGGENPFPEDVLLSGEA